MGLKFKTEVSVKMGRIVFDEILNLHKEILNSLHDEIHLDRIMTTQTADYYINRLNWLGRQQFELTLLPLEVDENKE